MALLQSSLFLIATVLLTNLIDAYPSGAPKKVCTGPMIPQHHPANPQPSSTSPITTFKTSWNSDGETISIELKSKQPIKGIFMQGREMNGNEPIGTFINLSSEMHLVQCPTGDGVTHNSPQTWEQLQLTWKKPTSMKSQGTIQFWATIVVDYHHFWVIKSI